MRVDVRSARRPRPGRARGTTRKLAFLLAAAAMAALPMARSGAADAPPSIFDINVSAAPVTNDLTAATVLPLPLDNGVARSSVSMNSQPFVISQAAVGWVPLAETVLAAQPDAAALAWCYSYFPTAPGSPGEARCGGGTALPAGLPVEAGSGHTVTTGDENDPTTLQSRASARASGIGGDASGLPAPLSIGGAASSAESKGEDDRMTAAGSTAVTDIDIAGVVAIRSVHSFVTGAISGEAGGAAVERDLVVEGASVAGQPVEIDETGVHAVGQPALPLVGADAQTAVNEALSSAGLRMTVTPAPEPTISDDGTEVRASSGSLRIEFDNVQSATFTRLDIGEVDLTMQASRATEFVFEEESVSPAPPVDGRAPGAPPPAATSPSDLAQPTVSAGTPTLRPRATAPRPPSPPGPGEGAGDATRQAFNVAASPIAADQWDLPYPPFALVVLAIPIATRLRRITTSRRSSDGT